MQTLSFEHTVKFYEGRTAAGEAISFPIVTVGLVQADGSRIGLPLLFDTGASVTTLRHDLYPLLGLPSWDVGELQDVGTAGGENLVPAYRYEVRLEFFGREIQCPIHLQKLPRSALYLGCSVGSKSLRNSVSVSGRGAKNYTRPSGPDPS